MKIGEGFIKIIKALILAMSLFNLFIFPVPYKKAAYDETVAKQLLKETYGPLENFVSDAIPTKDEKFLRVSEDIKSEQDFIESFNNKMDQSTLERFFEDLVVEKQGELYIDATVYIPNIYAEHGKVTEAYIKKYKSAASFIFPNIPAKAEKLIIKEGWELSEEWHGRTNYFIKDKTGQWKFEHFNGTSMYGYTDPAQNPWNDIDRSR